ASIQVFTVPNEKSSHLDQIGRGFTDASDKRLEGKTKTVWEREVHKATRAWLRKSIRDYKDSSFGIENICKETSVPLVAFGFRSKISGSEHHSWIAVAAWQDALLRDLVRGLDTETLIVPKKGEIITAPDKKFAKGGS